MIPYPVPGSASATVLRQITLPRAAIVAAVSAFRRAAGAAGPRRGTWHAAGCPQTTRPSWTGSRSPSPSSRSRGLQAVGSTDTVFPFLYELSWGPRESFSLARLRRHGPRGPAIRLLPGAGDELLRLGPLIRPLVELHWTRMVAEINGVASAELHLHRHLFGADRVRPPRPLRNGIAVLQTVRLGRPQAN